MQQSEVFINIMKIQSSIIEKGLKEDLYKTIKKEKENGEEDFYSRLRRLRKNQKIYRTLMKNFIWRELQAEEKTCLK